MLQELTKMFSKKGYEGLYLQFAVFSTAAIYAAFGNAIEEKEYFELRAKQISRKIKIQESKFRH